MKMQIVVPSIIIIPLVILAFIAVFIGLITFSLLCFNIIYGIITDKDGYFYKMKHRKDKMKEGKDDVAD